MPDPTFKIDSTTVLSKSGTTVSIDSGVIKTGVTDGSNASAGQVGEYLSTSVNAKAISSSASNMMSLSITAGDWDLFAMCQFNGATAQFFNATLTTSSATNGSTSDIGVSRFIIPVISAVGQGQGSIHLRANVTSTTTYYLVALTNAGSGDWFYGSLNARRMR